VAPNSILFSPLQIRGLSLKNRIVMPPMANNRATLAGDVTDALTEHYTARAPGVGLVMIEHTYVATAGRVHPNQLGINEDSNVPGLMRLASAVRVAGAPAAIQITHAGGRTTLEACGTQPEGPSAVPVPPQGSVVPRELTPDDLAVLRQAYASAARRAKMAGFAAVEVHGAHGYLLNQFYSPLTNHRTDAYGGDRARRLRFPLQVVSSVRQAVGPDYPLFYRLGADDLVPGGLGVEDAVYAAVALQDAGADMIDVSGGLSGSRPEGVSGEGYFSHLSAAVKAAVRVPVMVAGGVVTAQGAEKLLRNGQADLIGVGRALLADPEWAFKAAAELSAGR
jgi:2,4-dienoyl-CoA reductase-like NADH-dependent reductase (Old Yellow Enzyme family)